MRKSLIVTFCYIIIWPGWYCLPNESEQKVYKPKQGVEIRTSNKDQSKRILRPRRTEQHMGLESSVTE